MTSDLPPCRSGKIPYASRAAAQQARVSVAGRRGENGALNAYTCEHCGAWHLRRGNGPRRAGFATQRRLSRLGAPVAQGSGE